MCSTCFGHEYIHHQELATVLLNYYIGRLVLSSLCVGNLVQLGLSGARFAGWSTAHKNWNKIASDIKLVFYSSTITMMHGPIDIRSCYKSLIAHELTSSFIATHPLKHLEGSEQCCGHCDFPFSLDGLWPLCDQQFAEPATRNVIDVMFVRAS